MKKKEKSTGSSSIYNSYCNQDNTKIENYFSIEFWNSNSFHIENKKL